MQEKLKSPFREVSWKVQSTSKDKAKGQIVPYVDARSVAERLDEALGFEGWHDSYQVLSTNPYVVLCRLTVVGVTKPSLQATIPTPWANSSRGTKKCTLGLGTRTISRQRRSARS
jgi:hypothetical protein